MLSDWKDAVINPIPIRRDISHCVTTAWRGINLLDVMGKSFAKLIQRRLQELRGGERCIQIPIHIFFSREEVLMFSARQLVEKYKEHNTEIFMLFIDLRKAYDSVPCQAN